MDRTEWRLVDLGKQPIAQRSDSDGVDEWLRGRIGQDADADVVSAFNVLEIGQPATD